MGNIFPRITRECLIEVGRPRRGRPSYAWVQGWVIEYSADRKSIPMRYKDALDVLRDERNKLSKGY